MSADPSPDSIGICLLTISDSRELKNDESGDYLENTLADNHYEIINREIVREDTDRLKRRFQTWIDSNESDVVISTGGTGISSRDRTLDVINDMLDKTLPGFGELFRQLSYEEVGAYTVMSRATAGRADDTLIIALPGSTNAVKLALNEIILEILPHMVKEIRT